MKLFILLMYWAEISISLPITNGFSVRFNPLFAKEEIKPKAFGTLFAKIPQGQSSEAEERREVVSRVFLPSEGPGLGEGSSNQIAKIMFPLKLLYANYSENWDLNNLVNLPMLPKPTQNYKILVATAPPQVRLNSKDAKELMVYVVFDDDNEIDTFDKTSIPSVYFVQKPAAKTNFTSIERKDNMILVDNNRTVTNLRSKMIPKFVHFKKQRHPSFNEYKIVN